LDISPHLAMQVAGLLRPSSLILDEHLHINYCEGNVGNNDVRHHHGLARGVKPTEVIVPDGPGSRPTATGPTRVADLPGRAWMQATAGHL
jgi:hypothetical protein